MTHIPKNIILCYDFLPHITHSKNIGHPCLEAHFSIALSFTTSCMPTFLICIHSFILFFSSFLASFSLHVSLTNKTIQFPFHDYIALFSLPCWSTPLDREIISFIVLPLFLSELVLTDVGFLKAHLSISISPSTSTPYLGYRLESILSTWRLACLNGKFSR